MTIANLSSPGNDPRKYKYLTLDNGLECLFVSHGEEQPPATIKRQSNTRCNAVNDSVGILPTINETDKLTGLMLSSDPLTPSMKRNSFSDKKRHSEKKRNSKHDFLAGHSNQEIAVSMTVGCGSFDEPDSCPGLAHFLEHLLFMGSKKYPVENYFDQELNRCGGSSNAFTDFEQTTFHFTCFEKELADILDIFANFFIDPLLSEDSGNRELSSIESEFALRFTSDDAKKQEVWRQTSIPTCPFGRFTCGNKKTLRDIPEQNGVNVMEAIRHLFNSHYVATNMELVIIGVSSSSRDIETLVSKSFKGIRKEPMCKRAYHGVPWRVGSSSLRQHLKNLKIWESLLKPPLEPVIPGIGGFSLGCLFVMTTERPIHEMSLTWQLPPQDYSGNRCVDFVATLIGHESNGSILALLKSKGLATHLNAECPRRSGFEDNTVCSMFTITCQLTSFGAQNWFEVIAIIFSYIGMLIDQKASAKQIFDEDLKMHRLRLLYQEQDEDYESLACFYSNAMLSQWSISIQNLLDEEATIFWDENFLEQTLNLLRPELLRVDILTDVPSLCITETGFEEFIEEYLRNRYWVYQIPDDVILIWNHRREGVHKEYAFQLPSPNPYIPHEENFFNSISVDGNLCGSAIQMKRKVRTKPKERDLQLGQEPLIAIQRALSTGGRLKSQYSTVSGIIEKHCDDLVLVRCETIAQWCSVGSMIKDETLELTVLGSKPFLATMISQENKSPRWLMSWFRSKSFLNKKFKNLNMNRMPTLMASALDDSLQVWHLNKTDNIQLGSVYVQLLTPYPYSSPIMPVLSDLLGVVLFEILRNESYMALSADLSMEICSDHQGLVFEFNGFMEKLDVFLKIVLSSLVDVSADNIEDQIFACMIDDLESAYINELCIQRSDHAVSAEIQRLLVPSYFSAELKLEFLRSISITMLVEFAQLMVLHASVNAFVHADILTGQQTAKTVTEIFQANSSKYSRRWVQGNPPVVCKVPYAAAVVDYSESWDTVTGMLYPVEAVEFEGNSIELYFQVGLDTVEHTEMLLVLCHLISEPLYNDLRTVHQVGYDVGCSISTVSNVVAFRIDVISNNIPPQSIVQMVNQFLRKFREQFLMKMTTAELQSQLSTIINKKLSVLSRPCTECEYFWLLVKRGNFPPKVSLENELQFLRNNVTVEKVIDAFDQWIHPESTTRRLVTVMMFGANHKNFTDEVLKRNKKITLVLERDLTDGLSTPRTNGCAFM